MQDAPSRWTTESAVFGAILLTVVIYLLRKRPGIIAVQGVLNYWQLFLGIILLIVAFRIWTAAGRRSVLVMPFEMSGPSPPRGLTGIALSRLVFDEIKIAFEDWEQSTAAGELAQKNSYAPELPKVAQPTAELGPAVTLDYKGLSIDSVLNFMRRLRGTVAVVTGELINSDAGIVIRCRCSIPAFFGSGLSKSHRESTASALEEWKLGESVRQVARMAAGDLQREACHELRPREAASMLVELGKRYSAFPNGDKFENLQEAIRCYDEALKIFTKQFYPKEWGLAMNHRGNAFRALPGPDRRANLLRAIESYAQALEVFSEIDDPKIWAGTTGNLGLTFHQLPDHEGEDNSGRAIECFDRALRVLSEKRSGNQVEWAKTSRNKANAIAARPRPDRTLNLTEALRIYEAALQIFAEKNREEWAYTMSAIGNANRQLPGPDRTDNLRTAVRLFDSALEVYTRTRYPIEWAQLMNQRGNACREMIGPDRSASLREAISCYDQALEVFVKERYPMQWASTLNNRGIAHRELPGPDRLANLAEALCCFDAALTIYTRNKYPVEWALSQNLRGTAYQQLPSPDRSENLREAIRSYEAALEIRTRKNFPADWAQTTRNRAVAYGQLPGPDRPSNLRESIVGLQQAMEVYTQFSYPEEWANTTRLMAHAYAELRVPYVSTGDASGISAPQEPSEPVKQR